MLSSDADSVIVSTTEPSRTLVVFLIRDLENLLAVFSNIFLRSSSEDLFSKTVTITTFSLFDFAANILNDITLVSIESLRDYRALRFLSMAGDVTVLSAFVFVPLIAHSYAFANALV